VFCKGYSYAKRLFFEFSFYVYIEEVKMSEINLKKLSRAELLEMMITFSEEAEAAKQHENELKEELEKEKLQLQHDMAEERAAMLKGFDEEKAEMRVKFNEQKAQMQAKFDKDIAGLKARLMREKEELQQQVDEAMAKIQNSQSLAEASIQLGGIMEAGQKAADIYVETLKKNAAKEYNDLMKEIEESRARIKAAEELSMKKIAEKELAASQASETVTEDTEEKPKKRTRKKKDE
jgi:hypothetical protein